MRHDNIDASHHAADNGDCVQHKCGNCRRSVHYQFHGLNVKGNALECPWCRGDTTELVELADHMDSCRQCADAWSETW